MKWMRIGGCVSAVLSLALAGCQSPETDLRASMDISWNGLEIFEVTEPRPGVEFIRAHRLLASDYSEKRWRSVPLWSDRDVRSVTECAAQQGVALDEQRRFPIPGAPEGDYTVLYSTRQTRLSQEDDPPASRAALLQCGVLLQDMALEPSSFFAPLAVNILMIDPLRFDGQLRVELAGNVVKGAHTVPDIVRQHGAFAAVNGSFFVERENDGLPGDVSGLLIVDGELVSEPVADRPLLVFDPAANPHYRIVRLNPSLSLERPGKPPILIDGLNRPAGVIRNCGALNDPRSKLPAHDLTCHDDGEVIVYNSLAGFIPDTDGVAAVHVDRNGAVSPWAGQGKLGDGDQLIVATGDRRAEIEALADEPGPVRLRGLETLRRPGVFALSGAPTLLKDGQPVLREHVEGWALGPASKPRRAEAVHRWINLRNPRTAAGITDDDRLILVTVDGRQPDTSAGMTIDELREFMAHLNVTDAINLDGGGSTTMVVDGEVVNFPSDESGPRAVADAITLSQN